MNDLQIFIYSGAQLRTIQQPDGLWWVLRDVCEVLGLSNPTVVASRLEDDERAKFSLGRQGEAIIINEPGLYSVILRSDKPEAKAFKRWVVHEVLPSIRKNGSYGMNTEALQELAEDIAIYQRAMNHMEVYVETPANDFISNRFMRKN